MNPDGTQDKNAVSLYETSNGLSPTYDVIDGSGNTAALKVTSHCTGLNARARLLIGGSENCVDLNNECRDIAIAADEYRVTGKYALSAKTCQGVTFFGRITGRPSHWHVNLGSWSDQSAAVQTGTHLALTADQYPILVWLGNATPPTLDDPAKYQLLGFGRYGPLVRRVCMFGWGLLKKLHLA